MTSSMMRGSSPALTPITIASDVAAIAVADRYIVGELHGLADAGLLADHKHLADHFQRRLDRVDVGARPGHHHGERALLGAA